MMSSVHPFVCVWYMLCDGVMCNRINYIANICSVLYLHVCSPVATKLQAFVRVVLVV